MTRKKLGIISLLRPYWKALAVAFVAVLVEGGANLLEPWPLKIVLDYVLGSKHMPGHLAYFINSMLGQGKSAILLFAALAVVGIAMIGAVSSYAEKYLTTSIGQRIMHDLRHMLYHHIQRLSLSYYEQKKTGDLIVRFTSDIDAIQDLVSTALLNIVISVLTLVGMLCVMFYLDWRFTLIALSVAPLLFIVVYTFTRRIKKAAREVKKKEGEIASVVQESLSFVRVIKAFSQENYELQKLDKESLESVDMALKARSVKAKLSPMVDIIVAIGTCLVLWYGARLVLNGELTTGSLLVFIIYLGKMYKPMRDLSKMTDTLSKASVAFERVKEVMETEREVRNLPGARVALPFKGKIEFEHVKFGYNSEQIIFNDLNMKIEPGQFVALVGPTGSGKSTIFSLIPRFYDVLSGSIKIDGNDIRKYKIKSLRQQISFVLQESALFRAPIWQNISYGKPEATREEIINAARLANAHEFIEKMPQGYNSVVGERGETLSGGQRQRIAIARAIIRNTPILLLDEPSSGLDSESEELVFEALNRLMQNKTSMVIAHRLSTVRRADIIHVLTDGSIKESGTHKELLARGGIYSRLYDIQFKQQEEEHEKASVLIS